MSSKFLEYKKKFWTTHKLKKHLIKQTGGTNSFEYDGGGRVAFTWNDTGTSGQSHAQIVDDVSVQVGHHHHVELLRVGCQLWWKLNWFFNDLTLIVFSNLIHFLMCLILKQQLFNFRTIGHSVRYVIKWILSMLD